MVAKDGPPGSENPIESPSVTGLNVAAVASISLLLSVARCSPAGRVRPLTLRIRTGRSPSVEPSGIGSSVAPSRGTVSEEGRTLSWKTLVVLYSKNGTKRSWLKP